MNKRLTITKLLTQSIAVLVLISIPIVSVAFDMPENVLVGLRYGNTAVNLAEIRADNGLSLGTITDEEFTEISDLDGNPKISAVVIDGVIIINDAEGNEIAGLDQDETYCLMPKDPDDLIRFNEARFRGGIILQKDANEKMTVINRLDPEEYLYGVIHQEMSQSNPIEALKAQAIAARNFIAVKENTHSALGFGVCTTTHCQVYKGYEGEYPNTNQAVDETRGLLMYSNGLPVEAYYHKNSGGYTENSENVWYAALSYLRSTLDPYAPEYSWDYSMSFEEVRSILESNGYNTGEIYGVSVGTRTDAGSVYDLDFNCEEGVITLQKDKIRSVFGSTNIKSCLFSVVSESAGMSVQGAEDKTQSENQLFVLSRGGNIAAANKDALYMTNGGDAVQLQPSTDPDGTMTLAGTGYGHRLGMSQDGAIAMANKGYTYEEILHFYYSDVEIR